MENLERQGNKEQGATVEEMEHPVKTAMETRVLPVHLVQTVFLVCPVCQA